ncbi:hypothetical protein ACFVXG_39505 [Kitasatospora sp. NPDC058162]|uniref:hypothetical protein n=1 Tax=Kitasatospora sp. NPDC058162 TaxID=3346362 RepID=UPI0036DCCC60
MVASDGTTYFGSDGGVWSRPSATRAQVGGFNDLNAGLRTLQYYGGQTGKNTAGTGDIFWGGLQDNGYSVSVPGDPAMYEPKGGDGFNVIVAPQDGRYSVAEYTNLALAKTLDGGHSWYNISPNCTNFKPTSTGTPCEKDGRFVAPFGADVANVQHWVAGGRYVWDNQGKGWATACTGATCDWQPVFDLGNGSAATAVTANGAVTYAGWCGTGNGCNPGGGSPFVAGIATNYGGTWHQVQAPNLPNRVVTAISVDQADAAHVVAVYGSYSRHWIDGAGTGHVFESHDGGTTWTDISGNLPDAPVNAVKIALGSLIVGTDNGVLAASPTAPTNWYRLGSGLPNTPVGDLSVAPDSSYLLVSTRNAQRCPCRNTGPVPPRPDADLRPGRHPQPGQVPSGTRRHPEPRRGQPGRRRTRPLRPRPRADEPARPHGCRPADAGPGPDASVPHGPLNERTLQQRADTGRTGPRPRSSRGPVAPHGRRRPPTPRRAGRTPPAPKPGAAGWPSTTRAAPGLEMSH